MRTRFPEICQPWTEKRIQNQLADWCMDKGHHSIIPKCNVLCHEADLISITDHGFIHEYEIKISREDFLADKSKERTHKLLQRRYAHARYPGPVYFWYAVPHDLHDRIIDHLPEYAGLLIVHTNFVKVVKNAPRLHSHVVVQQQLDYIHRGLMLRYWQSRIKTK